MRRALRKHEKELHQLLAAWLADHPFDANPVAFIELGDNQPDQPGLSKKIRPRVSALATLRGENFSPELIHSLENASPVPFGSVDLIVSEPPWIALVRVRPGAKGLS